MDEKVLSIEYDDDNRDYDAFSKYLEENTDRKKSLAYSEIEEMGNLYVSEIDVKKKMKGQMKLKLVDYILSCKDNKYGEDELSAYSYEDVLDIYNETRKRNRSAIVKFFYFIFNL